MVITKYSKLRNTLKCLITCRYVVILPRILFRKHEYIFTFPIIYCQTSP